MVEKTTVTYKGKKKKIPKSYVGNLKGKEKKAQVKSIMENKERPKTSAKPKRSKWTVMFDKKYGAEIDKLKGGRTKRNIAKVTGIPFKAIDEVYKKAEGAYYSAGSRPNQSPQSWAYARVYSYILGGNARKVDKAITEKYKVKFAK